MSWKNYLLQAITYLFSRPKNHLKDGEKPRILIVSTTGLGDTLWGTPAVRALKMGFPGAFIGVLTSPIGAALYRNNPHVDEIYPVQNPTLFSCIQLLPSLKKKKFEIALIFHLSQRPILPFVSLCSPQTVIGTAGLNKGLDTLLTHRLEKKYEHEIERRLKMAQIIGAPSKGTQMEIFLREEEQITIEKRFNFSSFPIGIHPGSKDPFKRWKGTHFANLGKRLQKEYGATIFITGGEEEKELAEKVASSIPGAQSVAGKLSVREMAALIEKCQLFLTNDTGPMHIAYAMKTPTFSLFSPTDPTLCGPYLIPHATFIQKNRTCTPCLGKACQVPFCLEQISEEEAWHHIQTLINL